MSNPQSSKPTHASRAALLTELASPSLWLALASFHGAESFIWTCIGSALTLFAAFLLSRSKPSWGAFLENAKGPGVLCALAMALPLLVVSGIVAPSLAHGLPWVLLLLFGGAGASLSLIRALCRLSTTRLTLGVGLLLGSYAASALVLMLPIILIGESMPVRVTLIGITALISGALSLRAPKVADSPALEGGTNGTPEALPAPQAGFMAGILGFMVLLAFFFGVTHSFPVGILGDMHDTFLASLVDDLVMCGALALWMMTVVFAREPSFLFQPLLIFGLFALLIAVFAFRDSLFFLLGLQFSGRTLLSICLCLIALSLVKRGSFHALPCFCLLLGLYRAGLAGGMLFGQTDAAHWFFGVFPHEGIYLLTALAAVIMVYLLLFAAGFFKEVQHAQAPTVTLVLETTFIDARCDEVGRAHGLKEREIEIVKLLCHGRSRRYIADSLYLSENTVKWYCRQIYQKLGIHRKQELLTLVGVSN